jgi:hypothetical protein
LPLGFGLKDENPNGQAGKKKGWMGCEPEKGRRLDAEELRRTCADPG